MTGRKAIFLDKDGTLVEDIPYNVDPLQIRLAPGAAEAVRRLSQQGYRLVVVSNQSGVARGLFPESALHPVIHTVHSLIQQAAGVPLDGFYYCPHHPQGVELAYRKECDCRKPAPGLLVRAANELGIDLRRSWMIGDILDDVEAGHRAGCKSALLDNGHETVWKPGPGREPYVRASTWPALVHQIQIADGARITSEAGRH